MGILSKMIMLGTLSLSCLAWADVEGKIVGVSDGDTVTLLTAEKTQVKVRLHGIDAPEKDQAFGQKSKENLSKLVFGKQVLVVTHGEDKYGRTIGEIMVEKNSANLEQVKAGFAWHYLQYAKDRKDLAEAEAAARKGKLGLWSEVNPMAPWEFRHRPAKPAAEEVKPVTGEGQAEKAPAPEAAANDSWINNKSAIRHNSSCKHYGVGNGHKGPATEGRACKLCGG